MKKIFLLEDDYCLNDTIKDMLNKNGFSVDAFYDGEKAFENILGEYVLYILDINVPNIDGIIILEKIKSVNSNAKVIIISANIDIDKITEAYEKDCDDYIKKPFDLQEFRLKIKKITNQLEIEKINNLSFCMKERILYDGDMKISLTKLEKNFLFLLLNNRGKKINHHQIEEFLYDGVAKTSVAIRTLIKRVRQKLSENTILNALDEGYYIK
ncbi:response regulator transcription factor [Aliarcobacter butzleri]|uniref:response regulator transcription factor n=1 Tax=Aliarcobacter butzleri TaxID=28197 RepID=UPI0021B46D66|nr:response regulator transcription factor [Aliarcobacter butzleri]MCT7596679.1 response regulator transcription factor [Aliarcobacter butzleri]